MLKPGAWEVVIITVSAVILLIVSGIAMKVGIWIGERGQQTAIKNAIAYCGEPNDCNTAQALATLQGMSNNGYKLAKHGLCWATAPEDIPQ